MPVILGQGNNLIFLMFRYWQGVLHLVRQYLEVVTCFILMSFYITSFTSAISSTFIYGRSE